MSYRRYLQVGLLLLTLGTTCDPVSTTTSVANSIQVDNQTYWVDYYPTQCNTNPWGNGYDESTIIGYYENQGVSVETIEVTAPKKGFLTCSACGCGTGYQVSIQTNASGREQLLELGFTEEVPEEVSNTNTNVNQTTNQIIPERSTSELEASQTEVSEADALLSVTAGRIETALQEYYQANGSYPENLAALELDIDPTGISYTPIGVLPAEFYDLTVNYSTGSETLNP